MATKAQRSKTKPPARTLEPVRPSFASRVLTTFWQPMPLVVISMSLALAMFWPQIVMRLPDLSSRAEYQITWSEIEVTPPDGWVPQDLVDRVQRQCGRVPSMSLLDDDLVGDLARAFAAEPWVESVKSVRKQAGKVRVEVSYRRPVLMVQTKRGLYPVDAQGVLLPPSDFTAADAGLFPRVDGIRTTPQRPAGMAWGDSAVIGASRLAARFMQGDDHESPWQRYELQSIVLLSERGPVADVEDLVFGLVTESGSRIVWGHAPGTDALEPTPAQKFERLDKFLAENGSFQYLDQPVLIDIRDWDLIRWDVLSKLPADGAAAR